MKKNDPEKIALALIVAACLFPPWKLTSGSVGQYSNLRWSFITEGRGSLDPLVLLVEFVAIGAVYYLLKRLVNDNGSKE